MCNQADADGFPGPAPQPGHADDSTTMPSMIVVCHACACLQVLPGSGEPADLRAAIAAALPQAPKPEQQVIKDGAILHMTLARLLAPAQHSRDSQSRGTRGGQV